MKKLLATTLLLAIAAPMLCTALSACGPEDNTGRLTFVAVNDLHGKFMDTDTQPGVDEFTTYIKNLYANKSREEIVLSSGDMWQGTVESSSNKGALMTEWMNDVGFVSMTLGNHEYDWGPDVLQPNSELAEFPFLAINVEYMGGPASYCKPSVIVEKAGVKVGIIGAIGDCLSSISGEFQTGLYFATGSALTELVKKESTRLRTEEGCDFIVYSIHDGGNTYSSSGVNTVTSDKLTNKESNNTYRDYYDTALSDGYVDLVFEGHTHQQYILKDKYGVYHLQGGGENRAICSAEVTFDEEGGYTVTPKLIQNKDYAKSSLADDPVVDDLYEKYFPVEDPYGDVLGKNADKWQSSDIAKTVAELYYKKGKAVWGSQYDIVLGGGFLKLRTPYDLAAGNVTYADLFSLMPFDNTIVLGKIRGDFLKSNFINYKQNYYKYSEGSLVADDFADGEYYYIIIDSYTSTYAPNHIEEVARLNEDIYARDLVAAYIREGNREA